MTDPITATCQKCTKSYQVKPTLAGKQVKCPNCGGPVDVPDTDPDEFYAEVIEGAEAEHLKSEQLTPPKPRTAEQKTVVTLDQRSLDAITYDINKCATEIVAAAESGKRSRGGQLIMLASELILAIAMVVFFLAGCCAGLEATISYLAAETIMEQIYAAQMGTASAVLFVCVFMAQLCGKD